MFINSSELNKGIMFEGLVSAFLYFFNEKRAGLLLLLFLFCGCCCLLLLFFQCQPLLVTIMSTYPTQFSFKLNLSKKALCRAVHYYCCYYYYETTNANKTHLANSPVFPKLLNSVRICCLWLPPKGCTQQALKEWGCSRYSTPKDGETAVDISATIPGLAQFSRNWGTRECVMPPFIRYQCTCWPRNFSPFA